MSGICGNFETILSASKPIIMHANLGDTPSDHNVARNNITEAVSAERQLWTLIHSRSPLDIDVQEFYHKARSIYENVVLYHHEFAQVHDIEHALWRLHYRLIDEFRKRIQVDSLAGACLDSNTSHDLALGKHGTDNLLEAFRTFLSEAIEFYKELIEKIKVHYGIAKELSICKEACFSNFPVSGEKGRFRFLCHRCLVCLGDLARYIELYGNRGSENRNWSVAATHYLKASILWPESGNAQNQLAILAMYTGNELLSMYHSVRSLAVKEPFLNAWDNLMFLFEKNRLSDFHSASKAASTFDFLKPYKRNVTRVKETTGVGQVNHNMPGASGDVASSDETCLWNLTVRMISLFFIKSSWEDFHGIFSLFTSELEALLSLDDSKLKASLESHQHTGYDTAVVGPSRALQLVCSLVFSVHTLEEKQKLKKTKCSEEMDQPVPVELALTTTFICMGRLIQRCTATNLVRTSPLLPAILVFVEWFVDWPDVAEINEADEKYSLALDYFAITFVDLLNRISESKEISSGSVDTSEPEYCRTALWEDYELRGFAPLAPTHESLYFTRRDGNSSGNDSEEHEHHYRARVYRILVAAMKASDSSNGSDRTRKWIYYGKSERKFYTGQSDKADLLDISPSGSMKETELQVAENSSMPILQHACGDPVHVEEQEEEIVFKPTVRHQGTSLGLFFKSLHNEIVASGGCRPLSFTGLPSNNDMTDSIAGCKLSHADYSITEPFFSSDFSIPFCFSGQTMTDTSRFGMTENGTAGPPSQLDRAPSLSAWGAKRENVDVSVGGDVMQVKISGGRYINSSGGSVEEISSNLGSRLSIHGTTGRQGEREITSSEGDFVGTGRTSTAINAGPPYSVPVPSAPPLPMPLEDGVSLPWTGDGITRHISATSTMLQDLMMDRKAMPSFVGASSPQVNNHLHSKWIRTGQGPPPLNSGLPWSNAYMPPFFPARIAADNGPWLHRQWNNPYWDCAHDLSWPASTYYSPTQFGRFQDVDASNFPTYNGWPLNCMDGATLQQQQHVYGADKEMMGRDYLGGYQMASCHRQGGVVDEILDRQLLLQYLKEKEWVLQQQQGQQQGHTQIRGPPLTSENTI